MAKIEKQKLTREMIEKAMKCKTAGELMKMAESEGYEMTKEEAEAAVRYCKYPMQGVRGIAMSHRAINYGMNKDDYFPVANRDLMVIIAIETPLGVENIREIVSVEGVDGIFIGPADLATSMGHLANPAHPISASITTIRQNLCTLVIPEGSIAASIIAYFGKDTVIVKESVPVIWALILPLCRDTIAFAMESPIP